MRSKGELFRLGAACCAASAVLLACLPAPALMMVSSGGREAVADRGWPEGVVEFANLPSRCRWVHCEGNFGWQSYTLEYRGDAAAFNEALVWFTGIRAPRLELAVREGPGKAAWSDDDDPPVDWSFSPTEAWTFHAYHNAPNWRHDHRLPDEPVPLPPPRVTLFVRPDGIQWRDVVVPPGIQVIDERTPAEKGALTGSVYDMGTGKPIREAVVHLYHREKDAKKVRPTPVDEHGRFRVEDVPEGRGYNVYVEADGYAPRHTGVYRGRTTEHREVYLAPAASAAGKVIDTNGDPVPELRIRVRDARGFDGQVYAPVEDRDFIPTDEEGRFLFTDLPEGYFSIAIDRRSDWLLLSGDLHRAPADDIRLLVARAGIRGKVVDHTGKPVSAEVAVRPLGDSVFAASSFGARSDEDGLFVRTDLAPGEYAVYVHAPDDHSHWDRLPPDARHVLVVPGKVVELELVAPLREGEEEVPPAQLQDEPAPALNVAEWVAGEPVTLESLRGTAAAIVFWRLDDESPADLAAVLNEVAATGTEVLAIHSSDGAPQALKQYANDHAARFRIARDREGPADTLGATFEQYAVAQTPTCYVIDPHGVVVYQNIPLKAMPKAVEQAKKAAKVE